MKNTLIPTGGEKGPAAEPRGRLSRHGAAICAAFTLSFAFHADAATKAGEIKIDAAGKHFLVQMQTDQSIKKCTYDSGTAKFTCADLAGAGPNFLYQGAVDINGNNLSDLVSLNISQGDRGDSITWPDFVGAQAVTSRQVRTLWRVDTVGDMDGDGVGDLVWRFTGQTPNFDDTGVSYVWFMNRDGTVNQVRKRGGAPLTWSLIGSADVNGDGAADMVYVSPTNAIRVLMATPNRTCANFSAGSIDPSYTPLYVADFTFVGTPDILARNATTGAVKLTTINASSITLPAYTGAPDDVNASCTSTSQAVPQVFVRDIQSDPTWQLYATGDFNNDGLIDIVWKKPDGVLAVWLMSPGGAAPIVNGNAGAAPLGYVGLAQSGTRTNSAETVTYAIAGGGGSPFLVTKNGATPVVNKTPFTIGVYPLGNCWLAQAALPDGKILASCLDALNLVRRSLYIDRGTNEIREYAGVVPPEINLLSLNPFDSRRPEWAAKARVADGWYYITPIANSVISFQNDSGVVSTIYTGDIRATGKVLQSYTK